MLYNHWSMLQNPMVYVLQHLLKGRSQKMESGETVVHIEIKDAEPVLLAELGQHQLLCLYAYTFTDLFIVFAQATIDGCSSLNVGSPPLKTLNKEWFAKAHSLLKTNYSVLNYTSWFVKCWYRQGVLCIRYWKSKLHISLKPKAVLPSENMMSSNGELLNSIVSSPLFR